MPQLLVPDAPMLCRLRAYRQWRTPPIMRSLWQAWDPASQQLLGTFCSESFSPISDTWAEESLLTSMLPLVYGWQEHAPGFETSSAETHVL